MTVNNRPATGHVQPFSTYRSRERSRSPSPVPIRRRIGLSVLDPNRIPLTLNSVQTVGDRKPTTHKRSLSDTNTYAYTDQSAPSGPHLSPENRQSSAHNVSFQQNSQVQLHTLPPFPQSQHVHQHQLQLPLRAQPRPTHFQRSDIVSSGNWSSSMNFMPHQNSSANEHPVGLFPQPLISQSPSVNGEADEGDLDPFASLSARTLALMDQPESEVTIYDCEYCEKTYQGKHARSIWRRHLSDKHKIPLATQPRRTRWDNDANRPKTEEERRERTLESKRRWARKNRAAKKAARENQKLGLGTGPGASASADTFDGPSRATTPSLSVSPVSYTHPLPPTSSFANSRLLVPSANMERSQSLQATDPNARDLGKPMARVSSAPYKAGPYSSNVSTIEPPGPHNSGPMSQFMSDWSLQFNTPILTGAYNIQSLPQLQLNSSVQQNFQGIGRAVSEGLLPNDSLQQAHHPNSIPRHGFQNPPFQSVTATSQHQHQSMYDMPNSDSKDSGLRAPYASQLAYSNYGNPPSAWAPSVKLDFSVAGGSPPQMIRSHENKRPRFSQSISARLVDATQFASLPTNTSYLSPTEARDQAFPQSRKLPNSHSPTSTSSRLVGDSISSLPTLTPHTLSLGLAKQTMPEELGVDDGSAGEERSETSDAEAEGRGEVECQDEEDEPPICSAASSTRCSTSAGIGADAAPVAPVFDLSKLEQQTPARPTGLRATARSAYDSPMNGDTHCEGGSRNDASRQLDPMDLFSSPMVSRSDADSSVYRGSFAPMSISRSSNLRKHNHSTVSSSGGSISHWSALQTPSDLSHYGRGDFGEGIGHSSIPSPGIIGRGFFDSPQHTSLSKSLGLAPSGTGGVDECLAGFLGPSWDVNQS